MKFNFFESFFPKIWNIKFYENPPIGSPGIPYGQMIFWKFFEKYETSNFMKSSHWWPRYSIWTDDFLKVFRKIWNIKFYENPPIGSPGIPYGQMIFWKFFEKSETSNFMKILPLAAQVFHTDRRTDGEDGCTDRQIWRAYIRSSKFCESDLKLSLHLTRNYLRK